MPKTETTDKTNIPKASRANFPSAIEEINAMVSTARPLSVASLPSTLLNTNWTKRGNLLRTSFGWLLASPP